MKTNKILGLILGVPLAFSGCSNMNKTGMNDNASVMNDQDMYAAQTSGAGAHGEFDGQDMGASLSPEDLLKETTFYFDFDRSDIKESDFKTLQAHASYLSSHPNARLRIEGHTDERGSREYNVALGERRAQSVARILMLDGADKSQIALVSYGEEKPAMQGHEEASWQYNRRGVLVYEAS